MPTAAAKRRLGALKEQLRQAVADLEQAARVGGSEGRYADALERARASVRRVRSDLLDLTGEASA